MDSRLPAPMGHAPLEIRGFFWDSASRWRLKGVELWRGLDRVGEITERSLILLLEHHLATAALQATIQEDLAFQREWPAPRKPPAKALESPDEVARAKLRKARRSRTGRGKFSRQQNQ